ncbi:MAG TPA: DUF4037 domain-containing protein [Streptosporangiaceae bacterium]|nr:DUF4037 domain-containing protein [Streptosporangiaceae bacterium]
MPGPSSDPNQGNVHAAWRLALARRAAQAYAVNPKLAALAAAGSVGSGFADRFSDLELDCYWFSAPDDRDRIGPIGALGGELTDLWEYDQDDEEWSEDYRLGELDVTVSNFLTTTIERFLDQVVLQADTDPVKHMRLAALQRSLPLVGEPTIASWRIRADRYPDKLVAAMVEQSLNPRALTGWAAREALASRGDDLAVSDLLNRVGHAVVGAVLALNRIYLPHRYLKWQRQLIAALDLAPDHLSQRLELLVSASADAIPAAEALLTETVLLAEAQAEVDLSAFRDELSQRRRAVDPPLACDAAD